MRHKRLPCGLGKVTADRDAAAVIEQKYRSVKVDGMLQIYDRPAAAEKKACIRLQRGGKVLKRLAHRQNGGLCGVNVDHVRKMLRVDEAGKRERYFGAI